MIQEGADVILPVGGPIGGGAYAALQESAAADYGIGVDVDWCQSAPQYCDVLLTSILKKIDVSVAAAVERGLNGEAAQPVFVSTLANGGVDMGPFNEYESAVPAGAQGRRRRPEGQDHLGRGQGRRLLRPLAVASAT